jgi:hypothetical protein
VKSRLLDITDEDSGKNNHNNNNNNNNSNTSQSKPNAVTSAGQSTWDVDDDLLDFDED